jgi:hypothetical protein
VPDACLPRRPAPPAEPYSPADHDAPVAQHRVRLLIGEGPSRHVPPVAPPTPAPRRAAPCPHQCSGLPERL